MTERTVEVEVTQTEEERVSICDHCGLEADDEDSVTLLPVESENIIEDPVWTVEPGPATELSKELAAQDAAIVALDTDHETVHYHDDCLAETTLAECETRVVSWSDYEGAEESPVTLTYTAADVAGAVMGIGMLATGAYHYQNANGFLGFGVAFIGVLFLAAALDYAWSQAHDPDEYLSRR